MHTMTQEPVRGLAPAATNANATNAAVTAGTNPGLQLRNILSEDALVFALMTVVLLITGLASGIVGVTALAALTCLASVIFTIEHAAGSIASAAAGR